MGYFSEGSWNRRAFLRSAGQTAALLASPPMLGAEALRLEIPHQGSPVEPALREFIERYMQAMYAPGVTLGLVHADGRSEAASFGLSDVARKLPVTPEMLFQIGSISKSFCALALLQMRDDGKLELQKPILEYLPWLPIETPYGKITVHHILTHTSGLPDDTPLFLSDRNARIKQGFKPGTQFHYCNLGFDILGCLAATLDGRTYAAVLRERLMKPLGMTASYPAISNAIRAGEAQSYVFYRDDLEHVRDARLEVAPRAVFDGAAGCVASTPGDMTHYMRMLLEGGKGPSGRIVSEESFALFATPFTEAEEFGKGAHYGYGIAVDTLDGHKILRHTGGMQSFASAMWADLDGRVAAFASINAMQGYRPNPVAKYAIQLMRAEAEKRPLPAAEALDNPREIDNAAEYTGVYTAAGESVQVSAEGQTLSLVIAGKRMRLSRHEGDSFVAEDAEWQAYSWDFARAEQTKGDAKTAGKPPVTELMYGRKWYVNAMYSGPKTIAAPARFAPYEGVYDSGTDGFSVVICKGKLFASGTPLMELGEGLFRLDDEPNSPETVEFLHVINGRARMAVVSGSPYWRLETV